MKDLSKLTPVKPDQGKAQWVEGQITGIAKDEPVRTHLVGIPPLMPCTTIFAHGLNSDGEWYQDAAMPFAEGLSKRLGRTDLESLESDKTQSRRFKRPKDRVATERRSNGRIFTRAQMTRHLRTWFARSLMLGGATLLSACSLGGFGRTQPRPIEIAAPQVAYRIDENRYFEIVPYGPGACTNAMVHFVDKARGIRSEAVKLDPGSMGAATLIIDASNDQYLVAPVTRGNTDCSSGGGLCGGSKLPYSTDGGRTWKRAEAPSPYDAIHLKGSLVRSLGVRDLASTIDLANGVPSLKDWKYEPNYILHLVKAPIDTKLHCTVNGKE